jgi:solute carrier family 25 (mitochondrial carnitine/acylcarnitine transporter), member 20/29
MSFNRSLKRLDPSITDPTKLNHVNLSKIWFAGALGGLASWVVSAPSELIKCRTQLHRGSKSNSLVILMHVWKEHGLRGLYLGGPVTSVRDSVGYGFYFSTYELCRRKFASQHPISKSEAADLDVLVSGGIAGIVTWASIYPLDVIKTRIQAEGWKDRWTKRNRFSRNSFAMGRILFKEEGLQALYRGLTVCSIRAFFVNAIQVFFSFFSWLFSYAHFL